MPASAVPVDPLINAALTRWEHHGRPGLPNSGFTLSRLPGKTRYGIYHADTAIPVLEPEEHILLMAPSPDGRHVALQLARKADEEAILAILEVTTGDLRQYPSIRCRYDPMLWSDDARTVEFAARDPHKIVRLTPSTNTMATRRVADAARVRLFPGGSYGMLTESRPGQPTRLVDRETGHCIASFPAIFSVTELDKGILVHHAGGIQLLDPSTGHEHWSWRDPSLTLTGLTTMHDVAYIIGVRAGESRLLEVVDGSTVKDTPVRYGGSAAVASGIANNDISNDEVYLLIEAPTLPPRIITVDELLRPTESSAAAKPQSTSMSESHSSRTRYLDLIADDAEPLTAVVTSPHGVDSPAPMILTCYGGFGVADLPVFEPTIPAWVEAGGHYATAYVRGGGEHGAAWREAGRGRNKQRGIEDLACIARGLIDAGLTRPELLILVGASHGGVLVTSCALGHPGLCSGVISTAAPLDLLSLEDHPLGAAWSQEFGDHDTIEGINEMHRISPLYRAQHFADGNADGTADTNHAVPPQFLGIILDEDSRVNGESTHAVATELERHGGWATVWHAAKTGHGGNHLDRLHSLGAVILSFAATVTSVASFETEGLQHR